MENVLQLEAWEQQAWGMGQNKLHLQLQWECVLTAAGHEPEHGIFLLWVVMTQYLFCRKVRCCRN